LETKIEIDEVEGFKS